MRNDTSDICGIYLFSLHLIPLVFAYDKSSKESNNLFLDIPDAWASHQRIPEY